MGVRRHHRATRLSDTKVLVTGTRTQWSEKLLRKVHRTLRRLQSPLAEGDSRFRVTLRCSQ